MEYILYSIVIVVRGFIFPDISSFLSVLVIYLFIPTIIGGICIANSPPQMVSPAHTCVKKGLTFLLLAELIGLSVYSLSGGFPYLLGDDFAPYMVLMSILVQVVVFLLTVFIGVTFKYASSP